MFMSKTVTTCLSAGILLSLAPYAMADRPITYQVEITNITQDQVFSPPLLVLHSPQHKLFSLGQAASPGLATLAETAGTDLLKEEITSLFSNAQVTTGTAPIPPGKTATYELSGGNKLSRLSLASMLVNTNDAFVSLNAISPQGSHVAIAYDAGSEANNELCTHVPGPACPGSANLRATDAAEGFIHVHNGIHGQGDLSAVKYDWRNPVALVNIRRIR
ncbi:hypothetical protein HMY34_05625 [Thiothrix subterranea]|uniref:spondin domain-containing protein n=1 Tax=Thiothrix subterranea TaxID=2735563 RepID=UPI00192C0660|nr:spondin domain-containing protein [Thiothrix subterranea]QQZ28277.1 hypothetical protein HMY34_05625 [Thiothrix subterranea]